MSALAGFRQGGHSPYGSRFKPMDRSNMLMPVAITKLFQSQQQNSTNKLEKTKAKIANVEAQIKEIEAGKAKFAKEYSDRNQIRAFWSYIEDAPTFTAEAFLTGINGLPIEQATKDKLKADLESIVRRSLHVHPEGQEAFALSTGFAIDERGLLAAGSELKRRSDERSTNLKLKNFLDTLRTEVISPLTQDVRDKYGNVVIPESFDKDIKLKQQKLESLQSSEKSQASNIDDFKKSIKEVMKMLKSGRSGKSSSKWSSLFGGFSNFRTIG